MTFVGLLAGYFTLFAAGAGLVFLLTRDSTPINMIECACLSWLFGVGIVSLGLWLGGIVISGLALQSLVTAACIALGVVGWRIKRTKPLQFSLPRPNGLMEWTLGALLLIELIAIFFVSLKHTLGWDGLLDWEIKARYAFLNSGVLPQSYYSSAGRAFSHPEYPLAIPFTELWLYLWMGAPHQFWIKTIFPLFYISGALLLALFIIRLTGKRWVGLLIALLIPFVPFVLASPGGVIVGYADIALSVFYVTAFAYLLCWLKSNSRRDMPVFVSVLTLIPWIKSEGLILWALLALLALLVGLIRHQIRPFIIAALPGLLLILTWRLYLKAMQCSPPADFGWPTFKLLGANISRLPTIGRIALAELSDIGLWSIFWLVALVAIIYLVAARSFMKLLLAAGLLGPLLLYLLTYVFSAWPSYTAHITSSFPRLLLQIVPVGWLAIGLALSSHPVKATKPESNIG
jgi:hypothetical protein